MKQLLKPNPIQILTLLGMAFLGIWLFPSQAVFAAAPTIQEVDYIDENIIINNNGNNRIYFATEIDAGKGNWEVMNADRESDGSLSTYSVLDFSWLSPNISNILMIKGENDPSNLKMKRIILMPRARQLDISINYMNIDKLDKTDTIATLLNIMSSEGTAQDPIVYSDLEWKKGDGGKWKDINSLTVAQLEKYQIMGANLYFRIKAEKDSLLGGIEPDGTKGRRASDEVLLKIVKKSAPMVVGIDGKNFTADIRYGKEYRVTANGITSDWVQVVDRSVRTIPLKNIMKHISSENYDGTTKDKAFPGMLIEIREYSTVREPSSKISVISLKPQRVLAEDMVEGDAPDSATSGIYVSYNGIKNINLTIPSATLNEPYEYCIVKPGDVFDLNRVIWTAITRNTPVKIVASKAMDGGTLYVRQKEIKAKAATRTTSAVDFELASSYVEFKINYPSVPVIEKNHYTFTKGYSSDITFNVTLNEGDKEPFETKVKNIKLGTRIIEADYSEPILVSAPTAPNELYRMTITLKATSLQVLPNTYNKAINIYFENGTIDKTSLRLTIQNPTPAIALTASAKEGTVVGTTSVTVTSTLGTGNTRYYTITSSEVKNKNTQDVLNTTDSNVHPFTSGANITIAPGNYITIYEISPTKNILKFKSVLITDNGIL